jgi:hypothetical protein
VQTRGQRGEALSITFTMWMSWTVTFPPDVVPFLAWAKGHASAMRRRWAYGSLHVDEDVTEEGVELLVRIEGQDGSHVLIGPDDDHAAG